MLPTIKFGMPKHEYLPGKPRSHLAGLALAR
jgi:hypothetical protein